MSFNDEIIKVMVSYFAVIIIAFFSIGFWFRGLYLSFIKTKLSGGRKILTNVKMPTHNYFRVGEIIEGNFLRYKDYGGSFKLINLDSDNNINPIYRMGTVNCINVDGVKGVIMTPNLEGVDTYDPAKIDLLYKRCLYQPPVFDNKEKLILGLLAIIAIGLIILGYVDYITYKAVAGLNAV